MATHYLFAKISKCILKVCAFMFRFACACHGLQSGFPNVRRFGLVFWFICAVTFPFTLMTYFYSAVIASKDRVSLSELIGTLGCFNYMISTFLTMFYFIVKHEAIEDLLQSDVTNTMDVFFPILGWTPFVIVCVSAMICIKSFQYIITYLCFMIFSLSMTILFMVYLHVTNDLLDQLGNLSELVRRPKVYWNVVTMEKWRIRDQIRTVNCFFANLLSFHHLQLFTATIFTVAALMGDQLLIHEKYILLASIVTFASVLYFIARKASQLTSQCVDAENQLLRLLGSGIKAHKAGMQLEMVSIFRYREDWDCLRVAHFTLSASGFLKYLSTTITCVAVVLQFDYKVMRSIQVWARTNSSS